MSFCFHVVVDGTGMFVGLVYDFLLTGAGGLDASARGQESGMRKVKELGLEKFCGTAQETE